MNNVNIYYSGLMGSWVKSIDTRATSGDIVADKNCQKLHYISPSIWCAGELLPSLSLIAHYPLFAVEPVLAGKNDSRWIGRSPNGQKEEHADLSF